MNILEPSPAEPRYSVSPTLPPSPTAVAAIEPTAAAEAAISKKPTSPQQIRYVKNPSPGDNLGRLSIPALEQNLLVVEGTRTSDLKKGVGHYIKSVMPGQKDNCVLSAHRDTFFSALGELKKGDRMTLETADGKYVYQVKRIRIVGKDDRTVIVPTDHGVLTLTTCYPFDYVGNAPKRYIVSADLVP